MIVAWLNAHVALLIEIFASAVYVAMAIMFHMRKREFDKLIREYRNVAQQKFMGFASSIALPGGGSIGFPGPNGGLLANVSFKQFAVKAIQAQMKHVEPQHVLGIGHILSLTHDVIIQKPGLKLTDGEALAVDQILMCIQDMYMDELRRRPIRASIGKTNIVGFRHWGVSKYAEGGCLYSPQTRDQWIPGEPLIAMHAVDSKECRGDNCMCGINAWNRVPPIWIHDDMDDMMVQTDIIFGEVYLGGRVRVFENGYRASQAYPKKFFGVSAVLVADLARTYGCEGQTFKKPSELVDLVRLQA